MFNLPSFGWFGVIAALLFIFAILTVTAFKNALNPKDRLKVHRILAMLGVMAALVHFAWALSKNF